MTPVPRIVVAGAGGDGGKTYVSLGLAAAWRRQGLSVAAFKKGPDYVDAAWLTRASGRPARNLDEFLMGSERVRDSFARHTRGMDIALVEGNRGIFDGYEGKSTAALARTLRAPVLLVVDATKVTRTTAAFVAGVRALAPDLGLAGVVVNRIGGARHRREVRQAIEEATGVPVLGFLPRARERLLPDRHLGLVPPEESFSPEEVLRRLAEVVTAEVDLAILLESARPTTSSGEPPTKVEAPPTADPAPAPGRTVRIGVFRDPAFTFYYPENLEALEAEGAEIVEVSALKDEVLPDVDLLYLGGGFPETHAERLAENARMLAAVRERARVGTPIYAECGGLVYLSRSVLFQGRRTAMAGVFDVDVVMERRPQGHGYAEMRVTAPNPFFAPGTTLHGHEFHYSRIAAGPNRSRLVMEVRRGEGSRGGRDGLVRGNAFGTWLHLHALGTPEWAPALVRAARSFSVRSSEGVRAV